MVCTFFGHHDCPASIQPLLMETIVDLIENKGVDMFYVGNNGRFDLLVHGVLRDLAAMYPNISYAVVLAYMPRHPGDGGLDTMLPEGIELVQPRYAITWRNRWMLKQADCVVAYITHGWGGAAQFVETAKPRGLDVYNLALELDKSRA